MSAAESQRTRLLELLEKYGRNLHSFMILEPGLSLWFTDDAAVAYSQKGGYWVAVGSPLCAPERTLEVCRAFRDAAQAARCKVVFFAVTEAFVNRVHGESFDALRVGMVATWDPTQWPAVLRASEKLRNRLSKAKRSGVSVRAVSDAEVAQGSDLRQQLVEIVDGWANQKALPAMGFMVTVELFQHAERRRYFVVESDGVIHGFAVCVPIYGQNGWLLEDMMMRPDAPPGCGESLVDSVMQHLANDGAQVVSLGMVALAGLDAGDHRSQHPYLTGLLRSCGKTMGWLYNFEGLYRFRNKMKPSAWHPVYIVSSGRVTFFTIRAILMAFAEGWVPRFAFRVVGRWARKWYQRGTGSHVQATPRRKPWIDAPIVTLALVCVMATTFAVLGARYAWWPWWFSIGLGFLGAFAGFTPVHEAVHTNVSQWRPLNAAVGHLCALLLTGAFRPYCFLHREHHLHTNARSEDPDFWCGEGPRWLLPLRWFTQDIGYLKFYFQRWSSRPLVERAELLFCSALYVGLAIATLAVDWRWCYAILMGWFVPARLALFALAATFSWLPHHPHEETNPYLATSVRSKSWLTWLLLGQNYHLVHHLDPSLPFYRLQRQWREHRAQYSAHGAIDHASPRD